MLTLKYKDTAWFKIIKRNKFLRAIVRLYREVRLLYYVLKDHLLFYLLQRLNKKFSMMEEQKPLLWFINIGDVTNPEQLKYLLTEKKIIFNEGTHTIYIPPQPKLDLFLGKMVEFYPSDAGFKILKNFTSPDKTSYIYGDEFLIKKALTGDMIDRVMAANTLYLLDIGPRMYDITEMAAKEIRLTCFVVSHVKGGEPTIDDYSYFINTLRGYIKDGLLKLVPREGLKHDDFASPNCNNNLLKSADNAKLLYLDFQQFIVCNNQLLNRILSKFEDNFHFGDTRIFRKEKYLYQSIPVLKKSGKRFTQKRWIIIKDLLQKFGIKFADRIILDIGCNAGMMLHMSLLDGARWGLGWDLPNVVREANKLHLILGNTRIDFIEANLHNEYPLAKDIPDRFQPWLNESIIFYLSVWRHFGFISDIGKLQWRALMLEGHQEDSVESLLKELKVLQSSWDFTTAEYMESRDGDSESRHLVLLIRK